MTITSIKDRLVLAARTPEARRQAWKGIASGVKGTLMVMGVLFIGSLYQRKMDTQLTWSSTNSLAVGLYAYDRTDVVDLKRDQIVLYRYTAPDWVRSRGWTHKQLIEKHLKRVKGLPGDRLEVRGAEVLVCPSGGVQMPCAVVAKRTPFDRNGIPWPAAPLPAVIPSDHYLLIGDHPLSFDGRYFGLVKRDQIEGRARPIWTEALSPEIYTTDWEKKLREDLAKRGLKPQLPDVAGS